MLNYIVFIHVPKWIRHGFPHFFKLEILLNIEDKFEVKEEKGGGGGVNKGVLMSVFISQMA